MREGKELITGGAGNPEPVFLWQPSSEMAWSFPCLLVRTCLYSRLTLNKANLVTKRVLRKWQWVTSKAQLEDIVASVLHSLRQLPLDEAWLQCHENSQSYLKVHRATDWSFRPANSQHQLVRHTSEPLWKSILQRTTASADILTTTSLKP